jgi:hypothetical protein
MINDRGRKKRCGEKIGGHSGGARPGTGVNAIKMPDLTVCVHRFFRTARDMRFLCEGLNMAGFESGGE